MPRRGTKQQLADLERKVDLLQGLERRVELLQDAVEENRRLNERLSDVIDVVTEVLVPTIDRDDEQLKAALARLNQTLA